MTVTFLKKYVNIERPHHDDNISIKRSFYDPALSSQEFMNKVSYQRLNCAWKGACMGSLYSTT